ncbi:hypothetical protein [Parasporobacterium paucivorans]|uniref:Uncharacterized protein n=1 Tax=Parasporobacterium paucivorans DSM 15970 TaxID=1122934 RepID=A0A1M6BEU4_9FIRM|nr:hypothetical protein [Parasporobacterium paucivorans]SHI47262.1 hypothetical protein SAMN02745691_00343 [Parasporobacterium paucivorans DSM 15970]
MNTGAIVFIISLVVLVSIIGALYFLSKRTEKKSKANQEALEAASQSMSFYIIDKKMMKIKDAGLPKIVYEQTPKYLRWTKVPVLKVKVGAKVMSLMCDEKIFPQLLPKQEVKASVSGIYVTAAKRIRGPVYEPKKKKGFFKGNFFKGNKR